VQRNTLRLLFVDDDDEFRDAATKWFAGRGHAVSAAASGEEALALAELTDLDVAIFDLRMPGLSGLDLLRRFKEAGCEAEVLMLTGEGTVETAVEALKLGAYDYVLKPCKLGELERRCRAACETARLRRENRNLRALVARDRRPPAILGDSPAIREVFRLIAKAGRSDAPILIEGESGTGKELVAHALHTASPRADRPLVTVNCAALPDQLLESEFFGHEKGAFTGASAAKLGLFDAADGGTLFVDEIGELALPLQAKLLRALEDGSFRRIGSLKERRADVRVIAATNRDLAEAVAEGRFREDLYYRVNVLSIRLPPLRDRDGDLPRLVTAFVGESWRIEEAARHALEQYDWPGNVRQLKNTLERAKVLADDDLIRLADLPREIAAPAARPGAAPDETAAGTGHGDDLAAHARGHVLAVIEREDGNKSRAARVLGVDRRTLYRMLERFGLHEPAAAAGDSPHPLRPR
jgi:DNA-binding NtrC family response regulator